MGILSSILGRVVKVGADYFTRRQEIKLKQHELKIQVMEAEAKRKADLLSQGLAADASWESIFAQQAASSWKDEYTLVVVSIPAILCFFPAGAKWVHAGFAALDRAPAWYILMLTTLFFATVGIRYYRRNQSDT